MTDEAQEIRALAERLARETGALLLKASPGKIESKSSPTDLVTEADHLAESFIIAELERHRPNDSRISEESGTHVGSSGITWVIDPLDGTVNFVYGIPQWCVSIGVEGRMRAGVIHNPVTSETFSDAAPCVASAVTDLSLALVGTGFAYDATTREAQGKVIAKVLPRVRDIRRGGSCALDLAWVACGRLDAFFEDATNHWDISAGIALIEASGGAVETDGSFTIAAGTKVLLDKLKSIAAS